MKRIVITGVGAACAFGGWEAFRRSVRDGHSGVSGIRLFQPNGLKSRVASQTGDRLLASIEVTKETKLYSRAVRHAVVAAKEAFETAGLDPKAFTEEEALDTAVYIGSGGGGIDIQESQYEIFFGASKKKVSPFAIPVSLVGMVSSELSTSFGLLGPSQVISTGCTSSTDAIGQGAWMMRTGAVKRALVGGTDACITPGLMTAFDRMGVVSTRFNDTPRNASRPFSRERDGFVLGEGSWMFVLETLEDAINRGAPIFAEVAGWAANCEAGHRVRMNEDGKMPARAMTKAMENAEVNREDVSYISFHGTGTLLNDAVETRAMKIVFGARPPAGSSPKSMLGHPQGSCGAMGLAATLAGMGEGFLPPTINLESPDPECDLDYIPCEARDGAIETALLNCMGFGSRNSALVVKKFK
ncbi:3-oxoacyl-[acyl-carrier-protein] synthase, KASII [hydrothermal vent metagenome]|uniref:Nodulation protein E n=1 Tax=hydrothermal vent metagenome TaxID=652676 RepID=A0A3B1BU22_9ZZZZ